MVVLSFSSSSPSPASIPMAVPSPARTQVGFVMATARLGARKRRLAAFPILLNSNLKGTLRESTHKETGMPPRPSLWACGVVVRRAACIACFGAKMAGSNEDKESSAGGGGGRESVAKEEYRRGAAGRSTSPQEGGSAGAQFTCFTSTKLVQEFKYEEAGARAGGPQRSTSPQEGGKPAPPGGRLANHPSSTANSSSIKVGSSLNVYTNIPPDISALIY